MIEIRSFADADFDAFQRLFSAYFAQDMQLEFTSQQLNSVCTDVADKAKAGIIACDLLLQNGSAVGFVIYQIDSTKSDWCEKEGYGFIRELFVEKTLHTGPGGAPAFPRRAGTVRTEGPRHLFNQRHRKQRLLGKAGLPQQRPGQCYKQLPHLYQIGLRTACRQ